MVKNVIYLYLKLSEIFQFFQPFMWNFIEISVNFSSRSAFGSLNLLHSYFMPHFRIVKHAAFSIHNNCYFFTRAHSSLILEMFSAPVHFSLSGQVLVYCTPIFFSIDPQGPLSRKMGFYGIWKWKTKLIVISVTKLRATPTKKLQVSVKIWTNHQHELLNNNCGCLATIWYWQLINVKFLGGMALTLQKWKPEL